MITQAQRQQAAEALLQAEIKRQPIQQVSKTWPDMQIEDAYAIQQLWAEGRVKAGARVVGNKIGLTSRAMQMASKMTEPDYGVLLDDMLYPDGARIPASRFHAPRLEVELAFVLGKPLGGKPNGPKITIYDVLDATAYITPALEIIDYRTEVPRAITDTIADNAAAAAMVTGGVWSNPWTWTCAGWAPPCLKMVSLKSPACRRPSWATRPTALCGWLTNWLCTAP